MLRQNERSGHAPLGDSCVSLEKFSATALITADTLGENPARCAGIRQEAPQGLGPCSRLIRWPIGLRESGDAAPQTFIVVGFGPRNQLRSEFVHHGSLTKIQADANYNWIGDALSMAASYCYKYPRPAVTVDFVIFALVGATLKVLLIQRKHDPFAGSWAIPGGFLEIDEPVETAVRRELLEETKLDYKGPVAPIGVFSDLGRDPRGRTISLAYATVIRTPLPEVGGADDAAEACWHEPGAVSPLAFDHDAIMEAALAWFGRDVIDGQAGLAILPRQFGDPEIQDLFRAIGKNARSATAWRNRLLREGKIQPVPRREGRYRSTTK